MTDTPSPSEAPSEPPIVVRGRIGGRPRSSRPLPGPGEVRRYVATSAQNNTYVHEGVWLNVLAMAEHYDAELLVGTYTYNKSAYGRKAIKRGSSPDRSHESWYDPQVVEHICDEQVQLAPGLVWCGEMNILPTAEHPLSKLEPYNQRNSNVVPHAKFTMNSVGALGGEATKHNYTTGTVTQRNYIQKRAGLIAEQYHGYGALLIEVLGDGSWFVRQLQATEDGTIRDLGLKAHGGVVTDGNPVEAITWGDVHVRCLDPDVAMTAWGPGGMLDELRPAHQLLHDVLDFRSRNHHEAKDPLASYRKWKAGEESVSDEVRDVVDFLCDVAYRPWCRSVVVPSNHHEALTRWLKETDISKDPVNMEFYHEAWLALIRGAPDAFKWACEHLVKNEHQYIRLKRAKWLVDDEPLVLAGVESGQHGHMGVNGARGNHKAFSKLGRASSTGHEHTAGIHLHNWVAGTMTHLRIGYNRGPSSWSQSQIVLYPEGTRAIVSFWKGKWRA